jgi:aldose 1-epimerase
MNFVIDGKPGVLRPAVKLSDPQTGIVMDVSTTQPCVQLYSDGIGDRSVVGKGGKIYRSFYAMSLETQNYLDAVNHPSFPANPSTIVAPGKPLHEVTVFKFTHG